MKISVSRIDIDGNKVGSSELVNVGLAQSGSMQFFDDATCSSEVSGLDIEAGSPEASVWVKNSQVEIVNVTLSDNSSSLSSGAISIDFTESINWWDSNWKKRIAIKLSNLDQAVDLIDQTVRVELNAARVDFDEIMAAGEDIRFIADDHSTQLDYEIESWVENSRAEIWVKVPLIKASSNQNYIYLYYNNTAAVAETQPEEVWSDFSSVWHFSEDPSLAGPQFKDSTSNNWDASIINSSGLTAGPLGQAVDLSADNDVIDVGQDLSTVLGYSSTLSVWLKTNQVGNNTSWLAPGITGVEGAGNSNDIFFGWIDASGYLGVTAGNGAAAKSNFVVNDDVWRHITITRDHISGQVQFFVNGVLNGSGISESGAKTIEFSEIGIIGDTGNTPHELDGSLEEMRIYNSVKSIDQIKADYKYMLDSYLTYGPSESL